MKLSLRWKLLAPAIACLVAAVLATVLFVGHSMRKAVLTEIERTTMTGLSDTVLVSLTTMMGAGIIKEQKDPFLKQMASFADLRVLRSSSLEQEYGRGKPEEHARDAAEAEVIKSGVAKTFIEGTSIRGIYPYVASHDKLGKNCLDCHHVSEGTVLGAISIRISLVESFARISKSQISFALLGLIGSLLFTAFLLALAKSIFKPIEVMTDRLSRVTEGDLSVGFDHDSSDEIGVLSSCLNKLVQTYRNFIGNTSASSSDIVTVVDHLSSGTREMAEGSQLQSAQVEQIATANEELSAAASDIARNCHLAEESARQANATAQEGSQVVESTISVMGAIADRVQSAARTVVTLGTRSDQIGEIIGTIEDIADQTNLLALNAAIEAARAGEQGRGFAVVADEVRALAERTTKATREISAMIGSIQTETRNAVDSMEEGVQEVERGTVEAAKSGKALGEILEVIGSVAMQINQIATAAEEQTATVQDINRNIQLVAEVTKGNEEVGKNIVGEVEILKGTAKELKALTVGFTLR